MVFDWPSDLTTETRDISDHSQVTLTFAIWVFLIGKVLPELQFAPTRAINGDSGWLHDSFVSKDDIVDFDWLSREQV